MQRRINQAIDEVQLQRQWLRDHGDTLVAYVARYGSVHDPGHYGDGGEAIYEADKAALDRAERNLLIALQAKHSFTKPGCCIRCGLETKPNALCWRCQNAA